VSIPVWLRAVLFIAIVPGTVAGWLPWQIAGGPSNVWDASHGAWRLGVVPILAGWVVLLWCAREFALRGHGTPGPWDAPRQLVISGLYRFTRNPMYVAVLTAILGQALWFHSRRVAWYALVTAIVFHLMVVLYEEPTLEGTFGREYTEYRRRVRRWFC
jgi:protein-S-isoprenylcysteine O-methyltransferase Ste14